MENQTSDLVHRRKENMLENIQNVIKIKSAERKAEIRHASTIIFEQKPRFSVDINKVK